MAVNVTSFWKVSTESSSVAHSESIIWRIVAQILEKKYRVSFVTVLEAFHWHIGFHCDKRMDWCYKDACRGWCLTFILLGVLGQYFHFGRSQITACLGRDIFIRSHLTVRQVIKQLPYWSAAPSVWRLLFLGVSGNHEILFFQVQLYSCSDKSKDLVSLVLLAASYCTEHSLIPASYKKYWTCSSSWQTYDKA